MHFCYKLRLIYFHNIPIGLPRSSGGEVSRSLFIHITVSDQKKFSENVIWLKISARIDKKIFKERKEKENIIYLIRKFHLIKHAAYLTQKVNPKFFLTRDLFISDKYFGCLCNI